MSDAAIAIPFLGVVVILVVWGIVHGIREMRHGAEDLEEHMAERAAAQHTEVLETNHGNYIITFRSLKGQPHSALGEMKRLLNANATIDLKEFASELGVDFIRIIPPPPQPKKDKLDPFLGEEDEDTTEPPQG